MFHDQPYKARILAAWVVLFVFVLVTGYFAAKSDSGPRIIPTDPARPPQIIFAPAFLAAALGGLSAIYLLANEGRKMSNRMSRRMVYSCIPVEFAVLITLISLAFAPPFVWSDFVLGAGILYVAAMVTVAMFREGSAKDGPKPPKD